MKQALLFLSLILLLSSCNRNKYITKTNYDLAKQHNTVAVLPVDVITTGNLPKSLTQEEIKKINEAESEFFQDIILSAILRKNKTKNPYQVQFLSTDQVNNVLAKEGITVSNFQDYSPNELATILGVDGVVQAKVKKERFMSETASSLIKAGEILVDIVTETPFNLPWNANRTYEIDLKLGVVDGASGIVIYNRTVDASIDFRNDSEDAVEQLSRKISRNFPYRDYKY